MEEIYFSQINTPFWLNRVLYLESNQDDSDGALEKEKHRREVMLFEALTQFMKNSALHAMEEIVGYAVKNLDRTR